MGLDFWVPIAVAAVGGGGLAKLIEVVVDRWKGRTEKRRAEVDRIARQLRDARRRERLATEWGHKNAVLAIRAGVPDDKLPVLDFRDDPEGVI